MKRYQFIALLLISTMPASWAQFPQISLPVRKGLIENAWVDPANPNTATPVTLHVTTADHLDLDRIETSKSRAMFRVKVYWQDPPAGSTGGPGQAEEPLGCLAKGSYTVFVQSYYAGRLVGTKRVSFRVAEGPSNGQSKCIDKIWIEPEEPVASEPATLYVSGEWPTAGYVLDARARSTSGNSVTVKMYWTRPTGDVAQVVTAYQEQVDLSTLREGTCTLKVDCYLNRIRVDWAQMSFEVKPGEDNPPSFPWPFPLPWPWPW
jgi:hypothetical protein